MEKTIKSIKELKTLKPLVDERVGEGLEGYTYYRISTELFEIIRQLFPDLIDTFVKRCEKNTNPDGLLNFGKDNKVIKDKDGDPLLTIYIEIDKIKQIAEQLKEEVK